MSARPCLDCGKPTQLGARCADCTANYRSAYNDPTYKAMQQLARQSLGQACPRCRRTMTKRNPPQVDHIVRRREGGNSTRANLRIICRHCNRSRG
jgi:5-methylcytosine-specific restriction endonuclease McrA